MVETMDVEEPQSYSKNINKRVKKINRRQGHLLLVVDGVVRSVIKTNIKSLIQFQL